MGSEQNDATSYQPSEPKLCANNCGFFGSACTENLCSRCFRDARINAEQTASAKAVMEKTLRSKTSKHHPVAVSAPGVGSSSSSSALVSSLSGDEPPSAVGSNRCLRCKKKVGLMGFKCKCGRTFCGLHRYPEKHECGFDFKSLGREEIAMANPVVKAEKVERI